MRATYVFGPIITCMLALGASAALGLKNLSQLNVALIPSSSNASARALPASMSDINSSPVTMTKSTRILTFSAWSPSQIHGLPCRRILLGCGQLICFHPALQRASSIFSIKSMASVAGELTPPINSVPENGLNFSAIRSIFFAVSTRGALNSANSRRASSAFWFASATLSFERRSNSPPTTFAFRPERISPYTPAAIPRSAIVNRIASGVLWRYTHRTPASKTNARTMSHAERLSLRACLSTSSCNSSMLHPVIGFLFLNRYPYRPPPRRYRDRQFWIGFGLLMLYAVAMLYLLVFFKPVP
jgi:hypothetical protein